MKNSLDSLYTAAQRLAEQIISSTRRLENASLALEQYSEAAFLQDTEGRVILSNSCFLRLFVDHAVVPGRSASAYLDPTTAELFNKSDALL